MATLFIEDWEGSAATVASHWAGSSPGTQLNPINGGLAVSLTSTKSHLGSQCMKEVVNGLTTRIPEFGPPGTSYIDASHAPVMTAFYRMWLWINSGFQLDPGNVKLLNIGDATRYPSWWVGNFNGSSSFSLQGQVIAEAALGQPAYGNPTYTENVAPLANPFDTWFALEVQITLNTPGTNNGILRIWINDVLRGEYLNRTFLGPSTANPGGNSSLARMNFVRFFAQHGVGTRYIDDFVVADSRIFAGSSPPPIDTTAPAQPTGLIVV